MESIAELAKGYEQAVRNGNGPLMPRNDIDRIIANSYSNRPTLDQLDATHPGVKRAIDAAYAWKKRYSASIDPENEAPPRAPSLVLSGPNGTGKTHIARSLLWGRVVCPVEENGRANLEQSRPAAKWFDSTDLILRLAAYQTEYHTVEYASVGSLIGSSPYAVVDDLGGEGIIPFVKGEDQPFERQSRWFRFFDFCYANNIPLIVTTNLDVQKGELADWIGRRAWDRLNEMAPVGQMVSMSGVPSWRVKEGGR